MVSAREVAEGSGEGGRKVIGGVCLSVPAFALIGFKRVVGDSAACGLWSR